MTVDAERSTPRQLWLSIDVLMGRDPSHQHWMRAIYTASSMTRSLLCESLELTPDRQRLHMRRPAVQCRRFAL